MTDNVIAFPKCTLEDMLARREMALDKLIIAEAALRISVRGPYDLDAVTEAERCADEFVSAHQALLPMRKL